MVHKRALCPLGSLMGTNGSNALVAVKERPSIPSSFSCPFSGIAIGDSWLRCFFLSDILEGSIENVQEFHFRVAHMALVDFSSCFS